ncbi:hypothetical protein Tco_1005019 [Tanacetum coccineum]|uniref:Uncharacterized protein n=1 Tax=Tanacetum coccineum TaxID=301880 RepID=A0ABQ5FDH9_9ASTR
MPHRRRRVSARMMEYATQCPNAHCHRQLAEVYNVQRSLCDHSTIIVCAHARCTLLANDNSGLSVRGLHKKPPHVVYRVATGPPLLYSTALRSRDLFDICSKKPSRRLLLLCRSALRSTVR